MTDKLREAVFATIPPVEEDTARRDFCKYAMEALVKVLRDHCEGDLDLTVAGLAVLQADHIVKLYRKPLDS